MKLGLVIVLGCAACGGSATSWTSKDTSSMQDAVRLGKACSSLCTSDAGCTPEQAAGCFDSMDCNVGSALARHGQDDLQGGATDSGCAPAGAKQ